MSRADFEGSFAVTRRSFLLIRIFFCQILPRHVSGGLESILGILESKLVVRRFLFGLGIGFLGGLQFPELQIELVASLNHFPESLVKIFPVAFAERATCVLV